MVNCGWFDQLGGRAKSQSVAHARACPIWALALLPPGACVSPNSVTVAPGRRLRTRTSAAFGQIGPTRTGVGSFGAGFTPDRRPEAARVVALLRPLLRRDLIGAARRLDELRPHRRADERIAGELVGVVLDDEADAFVQAGDVDREIAFEAGAAPPGTPGIRRLALSGAGARAR